MVVRVHMIKRKVEFDPSAGSVVEGSGVGVSWPEATTKSGQ